MFSFSTDNIQNTHIQLRDAKNQIAFVESVLLNNDTILYIENIQKNPITYTLYGNTYHFGTYIFNELLFGLKEKPIEKIIGNLSWADAAGNWSNTIPFYYKFPLYLDNNLPYEYERISNEYSFAKNIIHLLFFSFIFME